MSKKIVLKNFEVKRIWWGDLKDSYECEASFSMEGINFTCNLPPDLSDLMVSVCRGKIAEQSAIALEHLRVLAAEEDIEVELEDSRG